VALERQGSPLVGDLAESGFTPAVGLDTVIEQKVCKQESH